MINLPKTCKVDKFIPKKTFYEKVNISNSLRQEFVDKLEKIVWKYKISEETLNTPKTENIEEIEVFEITLKEKYNSQNVIKIITKNIPYPILFCIKYREEFQYAIKYNEQIYFSEWDIYINFNLSALNIELIYNNIVKQLNNIDITETELDEELQKQNTINKLTNEINKLENKIRKEKQFNIKVDLNIKLLKLKKELEDLKSNG